MKQTHWDMNEGKIETQLNSYSYSYHNQHKKKANNYYSYLSLSNI